MWLLRPPALHLSPARVSLEVRPADELNSGGVSSGWIPTPGGSRTALTWTPDGQALVFVGRQDGVQRLYVRRLDGAEAHPIAGTEGGQVPAVSLDGQWVAFWAGGTIRKVPLDGGPAMDLASGIGSPPIGLAWDAGDRVFFGRSDDGLIWQIPRDGAPAAATTRGATDIGYTLPWPLPGGRVLLYTVRKRQWSWGDEEIVAQSVDSGNRKVLLTDAADARYVPTGHLVFLRRGTMFAVRFDAERLEVRGAPVAVLDSVTQALAGTNSSDVTGAGQYALSSTGTLAWLPGAVSPSTFAPDGRQSAAVSGGGIVIVTVENGTASVQPLFQTPHAERNPEISPDGRWLAYASNVSGRVEVYIRPYPGPGPAEQVSIDGGLSPAWHPGGKELFFVSAPDPAGERSVMSVEFDARSAVAAGRPRRLFVFDPRVLPFYCVPLRCYDVAPDGQRFYLVQSRTPPPPPAVTHINLIQNWFEELKAKVPGGVAK